MFRYPISRAVRTGSAQAVQGSDLSGLRPSLGSTWPLNWKTKSWAPVSSLCAPTFQSTVCRGTPAMSHVCVPEAARGADGGRTASLRGCAGPCLACGPESERTLPSCPRRGEGRSRPSSEFSACSRGRGGHYAHTPPPPSSLPATSLPRSSPAHSQSAQFSRQHPTDRHLLPWVSMDLGLSLRSTNY